MGLFRKHWFDDLERTKWSRRDETVVRTPCGGREAGWCPVGLPKLSKQLWLKSRSELPECLSEHRCNLLSGRGIYCV